MAHVRMPLYRNGYALLLSGIASSGLGMVFWWLAARSYPAPTVGLNSAAISAMMLLSGISQLSLTGALVRFVPVAGKAAHRLVGYAYLISGIIGLVAGLAFTVRLDLWAPALRPLLAGPIASLAFTGSIILWSIFGLQDSALTGLRQATWVPLENTLVALVKIALLLVFASLLHQYGIFAAWIVPVAVSLLPVNLLLFRRLLVHQVKETGNQASPRIATPVRKYVAGNYLGSLFFLASTTLLPIIVTSQLGARANAYFYMPWMITIGLQLIALNLTTSLTVEAARDHSNVNIYAYRVLVQSLRLLMPLVLVILLGAPFILRTFGRDYADAGTSLLRLLALAPIPNIFVALYISLARVQNRVRGIIAVQGAICVLTLGISYSLLHRLGITAVGVAWLGAQTIVALWLVVAVLGNVLRKGRRAHKRWIAV